MMRQNLVMFGTLLWLASCAPGNADDWRIDKQPTKTRSLARGSCGLLDPGDTLCQRDGDDTLWVCRELENGEAALEPSSCGNGLITKACYSARGTQQAECKSLRHIVNRTKHGVEPGSDVWFSRRSKLLWLDKMGWPSDGFGIGSKNCCRVCSGGKPCGDSCIARSKTCRVGAGCAC